MVAVPTSPGSGSLGGCLQGLMPQTLMHQEEFTARPNSTENISNLAQHHSEQPGLSHTDNLACALAPFSMEDDANRDLSVMVQETPMFFSPGPQENSTANQMNLDGYPSSTGGSSLSRGPSSLFGVDSTTGLTVASQLAPTQATALPQTQHAGTGPGDPQAIVARTGSAGLVQGILLPETTYYRRSDRPFPLKRYTVLLDEAIVDSDCGSEVVNSATGGIVGHIIQVVQCSRVQVVYVDSLADSVWDVNSRFDQEARLATLWYNKQPGPMSLQGGASAGTDVHGVEAIFRSPGFHSSAYPSQASHAPAESDVAKPPPWMTPTSSPPQAKFPFVEPASSMLALAENCARRSGQSKPQGMQFIHYSVSGGEAKRSASGSESEQHGVPESSPLSQRRDSPRQRGASPTELLPDRTCPNRACDYHKRGFRRRHDLIRHIITHYDGLMYCSLCPEAFTSAFTQEFQRVEPLKRHLAAVHGAAKFRKTLNKTERFLKMRIKDYPAVEDGHCSVCAQRFASATDLYNHIEGCVVRAMIERYAGKDAAAAADKWVPFPGASMQE